MYSTNGGPQMTITKEGDSREGDNRSQARLPMFSLLLTRTAPVLFQQHSLDLEFLFQANQ